MKKGLIKRKVCICKNNLKYNIDFGNLPLINNYKKKKTLDKYPNIITQCSKCLLIQLKYSVTDKLLFPKNYSYLSGNSKEKINNFQSLVSKIKKISSQNNIQILDIGSNDGSFLELAKKSKIKVLGIEPTNTAKISIKKNVNTIKKHLNLILTKKILNALSMLTNAIVLLGPLISSEMM